MKCTAIGVSNLMWFEGEDENIRYDDFLIDIEHILPFLKFGGHEHTVDELQEAALRFLEANENRMYITDEAVFELYE